jgi:hypothetical protein
MVEAGYIQVRETAEDIVKMISTHQYWRQHG